MRQLTKTEQNLLTQARARGYHSIETCYGRGPNGGRLGYGKRERDAMMKLQAKGLIRITSRQPWQEYNRGYCQSGNVFTFEPV